MGGKIAEDYCGSIGHASLFSFGPTKQADLGTGGALLLKNQRSLGDYRSASCDEQAKVKAEENVYRKDFYGQVANFVATANRHALVGLIDKYRPYLGGNPLKDELGAFDSQIFSQGIQLRIDKHSAYTNHLKDMPWMSIFSGPGMTPWRFVFRLPFTEPSSQHMFANLLREKGLDVSNWYFPAHLMMSSTVTQKLPGTETLSCSIFQLWLDDGVQLRDIPNHCETLIETWNKFEESQYEK